ncbi:chemotaxis protein CheD [Massilia sp. 9096]|uniref:chemotaxis protein CheD n=1 Tax=Massilia sp. 9096 TaxID=1500894 RepID=UPI00068C6BF4|nr:chemotaxis protein CheD [Massilia sp. 9096]
MNRMTGATLARTQPMMPGLVPRYVPDGCARDARRHVWTGQIEVGRGGDVLTALLGSCVGIGMIWRARGVCALAHCLLPEGVLDNGMHSARYVSTAVPALLAALGVRREQYDEVEIVIAGGARMLRLPGGDAAVGCRNILAAHAQLGSRGLQVAFEDVGGHQGRRLSIDCAAMSYKIERVAQTDPAPARRAVGLGAGAAV